MSKCLFPCPYPGEGDKSQSVNLKPSNKVPAKIASFEEEYIATFKEGELINNLWDQ